MAIPTSSSTISGMVSTTSQIEATPLLTSGFTITTQGTPSSLITPDDPALRPSVLDDNVLGQIVRRGTVQITDIDFLKN